MNLEIMEYSNLKIVEYDNMEVRSIEVDGERWWFAIDIAVQFGISKTDSMLRRLEPGESSTHTMRTATGMKTFSLINRGGINRIASTSHKAGAKKFQKWLFHEVIPAIQDTGRYEHPAGVQTLPKTFAEALRLAADLHEKLEIEQYKTQALTQVLTTATRELELAAPKVALVDRIVKSAGCYGVRIACGICNWKGFKHYAPIQKGFFQFLKVEMGFIYKEKNRLGFDYGDWLPKAEAITAGFVSNKALLYNEDDEHIGKQVVILPKGIEAIVRVLNTETKQLELP